jgi:predicted nucleic acid-binding protein
VIVIDTSVLIDGLTGLRRSEAAVRGALAEGEQILLPALVLYEWLRGPRLPQELAAQESLFPSESAVPFDKEQTTVSAGLVRSI